MTEGIKNKGENIENLTDSKVLLDFQAWEFLDAKR